jgi:hypothetical protein
MRGVHFEDCGRGVGNNIKINLREVGYESGIALN